MVSFTDHYNAISIDRLPSKTKTGKDSWKRFMKIILLCKPEFSSATKTSFFFIKNTKTTTLHQVTHGNTSNIVLKRMLRYFLKSSPRKKILKFQERICFFLLTTQKTTYSASVWLGNIKSSFKENASNLF